jgi:single-stranded-DNA-specific exonuclease
MTLWRVRAREPEREKGLAREGGTSEIAAGLLLARGVSTGREAEDFFSPSLDSSPDPFRMKGMEKAVEVLVEAARSGEKIVVFGDYDVDGVTAVAQLRAVFRALGADAVPFLPHRVRDGYGLKPETFRKVFAQHRPRAIVTVDCGIGAVEAVAEAAAAGVSVVVTDHHLPPERLPAGASIVNPRQPGCEYPNKDLCGAGVAFKIAQAIIRREGLTLSERSLAKVAALGTISDIVPLLGENRAIVAEGLAGLADPRAPGLKALLAEAGVCGRAPDAEEVAFRIGPRLNAAGRIDTADLALAVFEERDGEKALSIARELSLRNGERQQQERRVVEEARSRVASRESMPSVLIEADAGWPRGVLGIAASRLVREFHRPTLLFAEEGEKLVGSGRSVPGVSIHEILSEIRHLFEEFGGHAQACGATILRSRWDDFRREAGALFEARVAPEAKIPSLDIDGELDLAGAGEALLAELERFEPFGEGNRRPLFLARGVACPFPLQSVGQRGRRGALSQAGTTRRALAWGLSDRWEAARHGLLDVVYELRRDRFTGFPEIGIVDLAAAS